ncbi:hypothetical protein GUITHDRAFT_136968 [Guillardia theta CCMP2712]|uniref:HECT domain-containing protein n=1 Tax=Guillardia theta (strain CCMP2712) TaxID=905079 RepID=L1JIM4_GUITC|nr:hypothetical protein GUITHDRAFT_136968 [Guillardia theta CCMP2712]EKX48004.1 hypothetical protein GUITHDRAFT_136968 [Guillardia theta CCMP2712]|eukprot:XP_005834984.1 hypothetical protein GUITHDRAFT_136968 [Guillardia theta CCMP2712]
MPTLPWLQDVAFAFAMASHDRLGKDSTASAVAGDHDLVFSIMCYAFPADRWSLRARLEWVREQNMARYKHLFCPKMELFVDRMRPARAADQILECQSLHFAVPGNIDIATTVATGALSCRPSCACQAPRGSQSAEEQNSFVLVSSNTEEAPPRCESQGHGSEESRCWERLDGASWIAQSLAGDETASSNQDTPTAGTNDTACILGKLIGFSIINQIPLGIRLDIKLCKLLAGEVKRTVSLGEDNVADSNEIQQVVQGFPVIDIDSLRSSTHYFVFSDSEPIMEWFWRLLNSLNARARRFMLSWTLATDLSLTWLGYIDKQHYESARKAFEAELPQKLFAMGLQGRTSCCSGNDLSQLDWRTRSCNYEIFDSAPWVKRKKCRSFYGRKLLTPPFYIACQIFGNNLGRNATYCELLMPMFSNKDAVRKALMDLLPPDRTIEKPRNDLPVSVTQSCFYLCNYPLNSFKRFLPDRVELFMSLSVARIHPYPLMSDVSLIDAKVVIELKGSHKSTCEMSYLTASGCPSGKWYCPTDGNTYSSPSACSGVSATCTSFMYGFNTYQSSNGGDTGILCACVSIFAVVRGLKLLELLYCVYLMLKPRSTIRNTRPAQQACDILIQLACLLLSLMSAFPYACKADSTDEFIVTVLILVQSGMEWGLGMGFRADYSLNFNSYRHSVLTSFDCCVGVYMWQMYCLCLLADVVAASVLMASNSNPIGFVLAFAFTAGIVMKWYSAADHLRLPYEFRPYPYHAPPPANADLRIPTALPYNTSSSTVYTSNASAPPLPRMPDAEDAEEVMVSR